MFAKFANSGIAGVPERRFLQGGEGLWLVHAGAAEQVHGHRADLAHEDTDREVVPAFERLCRTSRRLLAEGRLTDGVTRLSRTQQNPGV